MNKNLDLPRYVREHGVRKPTHKEGVWRAAVDPLHRMCGTRNGSKREIKIAAGTLGPRGKEG